MATVDIPEDRPIEVTVGAPTFVTGIDGITEARAVELDAQTLAAAKAYADEIDTVPLEYVDDGDADAVAQAKAYTDTALVEATAHAESYTDAAIAGIDFPDTGVPEATIDAKDQAILTQAKAHADAKPMPDVTKAYVDSGLSEKSNTGHSHSFDSITERPTAYPPSTHQHSASDTTSGVFPPARLGTGTANGSSFLSGDGTFKVPPGATNAQIEAAVNAYLAANPPSAGQAVTFATGPIKTNQDYARASFQTVQYSPSPATNVGGGVWDGSSIWYAPVTGTYLLVGSIRFPDDTPSMAFSTGVHTNPTDGAHGLWTSSAPPSTRPMAQYTRILRVTKGQGLMQYLYHLSNLPAGATILRLISSGFGCNWSATLLSVG